MLSWQLSLIVKMLATKLRGLRFDPRAGLEKWIFLFLSSFPLLSLFLHIYFNVRSVLFVPTSRHTDILSRFPTINSRTIAAICEQIYCFRRPRTRRIAPAEFLSCSLPYSFLRSHAAVLEIPLIEYPMSLSLYGWGCHIGVTPPPPPTHLRCRPRRRRGPRAIPLAMLTMKKETQGFHNFHACFFFFFFLKGFSNFYRYGALLPGPSGRRSSVIKLDSSF